MVDDVLGYFLKHVRGLGFAASVFTTTIAWLALTRADVAREVAITIAIWVGAFCFHRLGSRLDKKLYDRLFGTEGVFSACLDEYRRAVRNKVAELEWQTTSIYKTAEIVFEHSGLWEEHVECALEISKAARTFVIPLFALVVWDAAHLPLPATFQDTWLRNTSTVGALFVVSLVAYLGLRIVHNRVLYRLMAAAERRRDLGEGTMMIETLPRHPAEGERVYRFYCQQVAASAANGQRPFAR